jgi:hypothetical protein
VNSFLVRSIAVAGRKPEALHHASRGAYSWRR